jgi:2,3-bisphosphoglycerate-independent phosphoglycerate mutase
MNGNTLFVLLDGMEDHPHPDLGGRKPYEVAEMPFLRSKAPIRLTTTGRAYTQLFLGEFFTGHPPEASRAALEALGFGLDMSDGRTAFRLSPARIDGGTVRWSYEGVRYEEAITDAFTSRLHLLDDADPDIRFFNNGRAVLTMEHDLPLPPLEGPPADSPYHAIPGPLGEIILEIQDELGITVYPWGCGCAGVCREPYVEQMTAVSSSPVALGVAASLGYETRLHREMEPRLPVAVEALERGNVFLHFDEIDESGHEKDPHKKIRLLERIDTLMELHFEDAGRIVVMVDHGTSCVTGEHILMDVPLWTNIETSMREGEVSALKDVVPALMGSGRGDR